MAKPLWSVRELVILLNICNDRSIAVRSDNSLLAGLRIDLFLEDAMKLVLYHVYPVLYFPGAVGDPFKYPTIDLSINVQMIWDFLKVPPLDLNHQFESHDEVFDMVVRHRFFHISRMTLRLGQLQMRTDCQEEYEILHEFMAWWFRGVDVYTGIRDPGYITYDEVTTLSLDFFCMDKKVFSDWEMQCAEWANQSSQLLILCAQWHINLSQIAKTSGVATIQVPHQQEQDNGAPQRDRFPQVPEILGYGASAFASSLVTIAILFMLFRKRIR